MAEIACPLDNLFGFEANLLVVKLNQLEREFCFVDQIPEQIFMTQRFRIF